MIYRKSEEIEELMWQVRAYRPEFEHLKDVRIACLTRDKHKIVSGKVVYADCTKVADKMKPVTPYDFIITFYLDALTKDADVQARIMYHELLHVGYDPETGKCRIVPHDLEDFKQCVNKWGTDWVLNPEGADAT